MCGGEDGAMRVVLRTGRCVCGGEYGPMCGGEDGPMCGGEDGAMCVAVRTGRCVWR